MDKQEIVFDNASITAEAASWIAQLDAGHINEADRLALREWAERSPRHLTELRELGAMWLDIDDILQITPEAVGVRAGFTSFISAFFRIRTGQFAGLAVALLAFFVIGFSFQTNSPQDFPKQKFEAEYQVIKGDNDVFALNDGSVLHANSGSSFSVQYSEKERRVNLYEGEVHFDIESSEGWPFHVYVRG